MSDHVLTYIQEHMSYKDGKLYWSSTCPSRRMRGKRAGGYTDQGYRNVFIRTRLYREHRLVFLYHHGYMPACIDHVNGVRDDNRIENLRAATQQSNTYNARLRKDTTSGIKGVSWHKARQKWRTYINVGKRTISLGYFEDKELAELVVSEARELYHAEFARDY